MSLNINISKRLKQLQHLKTFSTECEKSLNAFITDLNWDQKHIKQTDPMVLCPFDGNHRMSYKAIDKHLEKCKLRTKGFSSEEMESLSFSSSFWYETSPHIRPVVIDKQIETKILGRPIDDGIGIDRSTIELSSGQRLALYEHVIHKNRNERNGCKTNDMSQSVDLFSALKNSDQTLEHKEVVNEMESIAFRRDLKRRRQSYRCKGERVHSRGKSYTEILQQIIEKHCKTLDNTQESNPFANNSETETQTQTQTHKQMIENNKNNYKTNRKHKERRHHSQERHKRQKQ